MIELATERFHRLRKRRLADRLRDRDFEITFTKRNEPQSTEGTPMNRFYDEAASVATWRAEVAKDAASYAAEHDVPIDRAREIVGSSRVRLEKLDREHVLKLGGGSLPQSGANSAAINAGEMNRWHPWPTGFTYESWVASLVKDAINKSPGLKRSAAYDQVMSRPEVRKATESNRNARMIVASKLYG